MDTVSGTLTRVIFHQANFAIVSLAGAGTVKGPIIAPQVGLEYTFRGAWHEDPKFGRQFVADSYDVNLPTSNHGVRRYLAENCPGIGPAIACRLIEAYGDQALTVCKQDPERVAREVRGLKLERAQEIAGLLRNNEEQERLVLSLHELLGATKVSKSAVHRIIKEWGASAAVIIRNDPYELIKISGIGFTIADDVARRIGIAKEAPTRIKAGAVHVLEEQAFSEGHVYVPQLNLEILMVKLLQVEKALVREQLNAMVEARTLYRDGEAIYLGKLWAAESAVASKLRSLMQSAPRVAGAAAIAGLAPDQVAALEQALQSPVFVLTGAPGTGKTYTIRRLIESFGEAVVMLAAPTGKAAKRIFEQSGREARTIHKLLEPTFDPAGGFTFHYGKANQLPADVIVLDEVSMVDTLLMRSFLDAVAPGTRLILVGDTYQLPSVGPGNVLSEIIASGLVPCAELSTIKRQDPGDIILNSHRIKDGSDIIVNNRTSRDFFFLEESDEAVIVQVLVNAVSRQLKDAYKADPLREIQVIAPMRERGLLSCKALNVALRKELLGVDDAAGDAPRFVAGEKVIQTRNAYDLGIINGDIGFVVARCDDAKCRDCAGAKCWVVDFENPARRVHVPKKDCALELAYAVTCHKFQGSEARIVVVPVHKSFGGQLFQRNWIYTAISRAAKVCVLIGQREAVAGAISRNYQGRRFTRLAELMRKEEV